MRALFFVVIMLLSSQAANGASRVMAYVHGNEFLSDCQSPEEKCMYYLTGVADTLEMVAPRLTGICRPSAATIEQAFDVFISWLDQHPAERHRPAAKLAGLAFAEAWPCP